MDSSLHAALAHTAAIARQGEGGAVRGCLAGSRAPAAALAGTLVLEGGKHLQVTMRFVSMSLLVS